MPITSVTSDPDALTLTVVGDYPVTTERLWEAWVDPRRLERFWGPPSWPARFSRHDMVVGGRSVYTMTGPDGERASGYWIITGLEPGRSLELIDGFLGDDGEPNDDLPTVTMRFEFDATADGSRFVGITTFPDLAAMEQLAAMGMVEGITESMGQIDDVLADLAAFAAGRDTELQILDDTRVRISRVVRGTPRQVWQAHFDPAMLQRWMLGPDGWQMPVCEIAAEPGTPYRFEWESDDGANRFGFVGEVVEVDAPYRAVQTERMIGIDGPAVVNELTLTPVGGGTLLVVVVTYPSTELRDTVLATGMVDGMEASYARLDALASSTV